MVLSSPREQPSGVEDPVRVDCQPIRRVRSSTPAETRNKTIKAKEVWSTDELLPEGIGPYYKKFECTHAKDHRARGAGRRSGHLVRSTECKVSFSATMMYNKSEQAFQVKVSRCVTTHNHAVGREVFQNYPAQRQIRDEGVIDMVNELRLAGSKPRLILQYLRKNTELQWFRRNEWFQDPTFKIVLGYLKELGFHVLKLEVGIVNPMHSHISDVEPRRELISSNWAIRIFDPMQSKNNYLALEKQVNEVVPTIARKFTMKRVTSPYQEDMNNCGLYCAIFFECQVRGVPMPDLRRTVLGYLRFRYLFKACAGDREWK
ncbi:hypothetical protein PF007_g2168 [Phytophthora fragariae]|uniref:Ubiquitin-like protease family profile domain-containing protein n=1 Tax=Phytophthora fragariae TaxID=53985 RepID=A0A6A3TH06_9STRA|nr:hypothetical protein PF007_g2168 [Phytophthora fragariae]